ncbi:MAG: LacI family transcriptional regulator [Deltaproteobacteria bacterium]|nr:LacI family transcriptional regulator [Deltaproteobacteria bacterium]
MPATLHDVARAAGVSIKTVSRVVNGEDTVADATARRVRRSIGELGYVPNAMARRLVQRRTRMLGIVFHNRSWNWLSDLQRGAIERGLALGYEVLLHPCDVDSPDELVRILRIVDEGRLDGVVLTPPCSDWALLVSGLETRGVPLVRMAPSPGRMSGRAASGATAIVRANDHEGGRAAARHLYDLGHRRLGFVAGDPAQYSSQERRRGFLAGLGRGCTVIEHEGDFSFESGLAAGRALLTDDPAPTAIFACNDDMAAGVLAAAWEIGRPVPGALSIVGYDDVPLASQLRPTLTTIRQPTFDMAGRCVERLVARLDGEDSAGDATLDTRLVVRDSTAAACS